ncbi:MAG: hypothetical protein E2O50_00620 [Gammaproteobacteria bacterium]|nr:MAG: hypothetical protein E2O50_00620 [Gammaproteobacteria bacterium]
MSALKTMLMIALGLGTTWLAWQIAPASTSGMLTGVAYAQPVEKAAPAKGPTDAEIEEQLARIDAALAKEGEVKEFKPTEPLPADLAIEMSSEL